VPNDAILVTRYRPDMTEDQVAIVKRTWKIFRDIDPVLVGDVFYSKLFVEYPSLKHLFKTTREVQSAKLVDMLSLIVGRLDRLDELTEDIRQLALRHVGYGVRAAHYKSVGIALLWTLQQGLGADWNDEVQGAWEACYKLLSDTMINAAGYAKKDAV
jgi:hemoglobin-like flavoprotein